MRKPGPGQPPGMTSEDTLAQLRGKTLYAGSEEIGAIEEIFTNAGADRPALASVSGPDGTVLVPLVDADLGGDVITVDYDADTVAGAPAPEGDTLEETEFEAVYSHYGISDATIRSQSQP